MGGDALIGNSYKEFLPVLHIGFQAYNDKNFVATNNLFAVQIGTRKGVLDYFKPVRIYFQDNYFLVYRRYHQ